MTGPIEDQVMRALASVEDPELGVGIVDLGLVRRIEAGAGRVHVTIAMTTPSCPLGRLIADTAKAAVEAALPAGETVSVTLDRSFHWTPELAAPHVRERFTVTSVSLADRLRTAVSALLGRR